MITLFEDQRETVEALRTAMRRSRSVLLQSCTGSGKTTMATSMIQSAIRKGSKSIFVVPRKDLLVQTSNAFEREGIAHSYIAAGRGFNPHNNVWVGMIDSMARRLDVLPQADVVFIDEAHFGAGSLDKVIGHYKQRGAWIIGLSATPWKLSGKGLGCHYDEMVEGRSLAWLIKNKRLSDYRYFYGRTRPDLSRVGVTAGDYAKGELAGFMEQQGVIIGDCVRDYRERCLGRLHIVRCASIKHSLMVCEQFKNAGIPAVHVDADTPMVERAQIFKAFARREILVITFCDLLNFGFDLSLASGMDVCIESQSDLKPSKSLAGQMQFRGGRCE